MLTPDMLNTWIMVAAGFIKVGGNLKNLFSSHGLTDDEQNQILNALKDDNERRRAISAAIADL
jgi:hypothetical protein